MIAGIVGRNQIRTKRKIDMKIEKEINIYQTIEIDLTPEDIMLALDVSDCESRFEAMRGISSVHCFLNGIPDSILGELADHQRTVIIKAFEEFTNKLRNCGSKPDKDESGSADKNGD